MANPRQRRKQKSSTFRAVRHSKQTNKHPVIRGPPILQKMWDKKKTVKQNYASMGLVAESSKMAQQQQLTVVERGRIVRDADGNVINVGMEEVENRQEIMATPVIVELEQLSSSAPWSAPRHASEGEIAVLQKLIDKHGIENVEQMARDRRLNTQQHTAGQLRRAIARAHLQD